MTAKSKNARGILAGLSDLPRPDIGGLPTVDICAMIESIGEPSAPEPEKKKKQIAGEAAGLTGLPLSITRQNVKNYVYDLASSRKAVATIGRLPELDETFHCLMSGDYHGFDLVIAVHDLAGEPINELHVTTLGFNRHNMTHLFGMLDRGRIGTVRMVCSEYFAGADKDTFIFAKEELAKRGHPLVATRNHTKILLFSIGERLFCVESSANLRSCNNIEQFTLCQSPAVYHFHRAWIERVISHAN